MWLRAGICLVVLSVGAPAYAASCDDYDADERAVVGMLKYENAGSLQDAYERLADTWLCLHPNASTSEFVGWVHGVQSNQSGSANLQVRVFGAERVLVIWARGDVPDGGRAALYVRHDGAWTRRASVPLEWTPEIIATLGDHVVVRERNNIPRVTTGNIRVLRVEANQLKEQWLEPDTDNARLVSQTDRNVVIAFERSPRRFSIDETTLRLGYTLTITVRGKTTVATTQASTPALEALEQFCASSNVSQVAQRLIDCASMRVTRVHSLVGRKQDLDIEAPLVCEARDGSIGAIDRAVLSIERANGMYRVARLHGQGCTLVRARRKDEPL